MGHARPGSICLLGVTVRQSRPSRRPAAVLGPLLTAVLTALLTATLLVGGASPAGANARVERAIELDLTQKDWRTFKLVGTVEALVDGKVLIQRKKCQKCSWRTVTKERTNEKTRFKTKIYAPQTGKWLWRVRVNAQDGWDRSYSEKIATYLR